MATLLLNGKYKVFFLYTWSCTWENCWDDDSKKVLIVIRDKNIISIYNRLKFIGKLKSIAFDIRWEFLLTWFKVLGIAKVKYIIKFLIKVNIGFNNYSLSDPSSFWPIGEVIDADLPSINEPAL